jgi:hypothetical protein
MAINFLQVKTLRRLILLALPAFLMACVASQPVPKGVIETQPIPTPTVRAPKVGQEWVYQVRNVFNQEIIDTITEKVVSVGNEVRIARKSLKSGSLTDEIQSPWGFVLQDPHWQPPQKFAKPISLWPQQLQIGWSEFFTTHYQVPNYPDGSYYWGLSMTASQWGRIQTPAGEFTVLRFHNEIPNFVSNDLFRVGNVRQEDLWFAPEIGRWAIRRSSGRYITSGVYWSNAYWEDYLEWELISWK